MAQESITTLTKDTLLGFCQMAFVCLLTVRGGKNSYSNVQFYC